MKDVNDSAVCWPMWIVTAVGPCPEAPSGATIIMHPARPRPRVVVYHHAQTDLLGRCVIRRWGFRCPAPVMR